MSSYHGKALPPISDEVMLEKFAAALWEARFPDRQTVLVGRRGQGQHGLDVLVTTNGGKTIGIQCKAVKCLTKVMLAEEVAKALEHKPRIERFILVTSAPHDVALVAEAQRLTELHDEEDLFSVTVYGWGEVMRLVEPHPEVISRFYPEFVSQVETRAERITLPVGEDLSIDMEDTELSLFCSETAARLKKPSGGVIRVVHPAEQKLLTEIEAIDALENLTTDARMHRSNLQAMLERIAPKIRRLEIAIALLLADQDVRSPWLIGPAWADTAIVLRKLVVDVLRPPTSGKLDVLSLKIRSLRRQALVTWIELAGEDKAEFLARNPTYTPNFFLGDVMDLGEGIAIKHALPAGLARIVQFSDSHEVSVEDLRREGDLSVCSWSVEAA